MSVLYRAVRHAVLHFEVRRGEFVPLIKLSPVYRDSLFQRGVQKKRSSPEGSEIQRKPLEMRWRRSATRRASSAAFISLFLIGITSSYIERETGIEPATSSLGNWMSIESKQQSRLWHRLLNHRNRHFSRFRRASSLNAVILR